MPSDRNLSPAIHKTTVKTRSSSPLCPWHSQLTLDLLVHVLSRTLFHPFLAALLPLCLRAIAAPYDSSSFILACAFAISVSLYRVLDVWNRRLAYGAPREIDWENEVVVITGGVAGLGGCLAEIFALRGVGVAVLDIAVDGNILKSGEEKEGVKYYYCDVGDYEQVEEVWKSVVKDLGSPTILINNAAVVSDRAFLEQTREDVERTFRINTFSHYHLTRLFIQLLLDRTSGGALITVSSILAHLGASHLSTYTASKAALTAYHASLSVELASTAPQIKTILVATGQLDTQLFGNVKLRGWWRNFFGPVLGAGEVAVKIVEMIDRGEGGVVAEPAYARWIAWLGVLPVGIQRAAKRWSGTDDAFARSAAGAVDEEEDTNSDNEKATRDEE